MPVSDFKKKQPATNVSSKATTLMPKPENANSSNNVIHDLLTSADAPQIITNTYKWFYLACVVSFFASALAFYTAHILAGIKLLFAGIGGLVCNYLFGVVIGSFVLSCLVSFALGCILAWYIIKGKSEHSGINLESWIAAKTQIAANEATAIAAKIKT